MLAMGVCITVWDVGRVQVLAAGLGAAGHLCKERLGLPHASHRQFWLVPTSSERPTIGYKLTWSTNLVMPLGKRILKRQITAWQWGAKCEKQSCEHHSQRRRGGAEVALQLVERLWWSRNPWNRYPWSSAWEGPHTGARVKHEEEGAAERNHYRLTKNPHSSSYLHCSGQEGGRGVRSEGVWFWEKGTGGGRCFRFCLCFPLPQFISADKKLNKCSLSHVCFSWDGN